MLTRFPTHAVLRRTSLPIAAALFAALAASPARAEGSTATTMTPPAPNAANSGPQSENSLPENAETSTYNDPGSRLGTASVPVVRAGGGAQLPSR